MKKIIYMACMCAFSIGLLSGCGGESAEEAGKDASGHNVSGQAVSGQAVSGQSIQTDGEESDSPEKDAKKKNSEEVLDSRYCTEGYYYTVVCDEEEEDFYVVQISLETGKRRKFKMDEWAYPVCVEKDVLYCIKSTDQVGYSGLWQIPIERHEDGSEELKTDRQEMIKGLDDIYFENDYIYVDDTYIVYSGGGDDEAEVVICYKRESGEKVRMPADEKAQECVECNTVKIYRKGDCLELVTLNGIVTWDVRTGNVSVCGDENLAHFLEDCLDEDDLVSTEKACFYIGGAINFYMDVWRIDMETKEKTDFVSENELWNILETKAGIPEKQVEDVYIAHMYYDENCLYIKLYIEYEKKGKRYTREIILSRKDTEGAPLQYEKKLTKYLWDGNGTRSLHTGKDYAESKSYCYGIRRGTACVCWGKDKGDYDRIIYDLKTGKTRPASWKDALIFE